MKTYHVSITHINESVYAWSGKAKSTLHAAQQARESFRPYLTDLDIDKIKVYRHKDKKHVPGTPWRVKVIDFTGNRPHPHAKELAA